MSIKDPKFIITDGMLEACTQFAKGSVGSSVDKYARRNQNNIAKITDDIRNGKLAEEGAWQKVSEIYPNLSKPDYNIYEKRQKSWDADLKDTAIPINVAVKSQEIKSEIAYGRSWVFQGAVGKKYDSDKGIFGDKDDNHYVCFISLNVPKRLGEIRGIVKVTWLHENGLFKPMQLKNLQGNKLAVYYEDLEKLSDQLWQI